MNCVGIDVSKGKSMIAVMRPLGEMVIPPFEVGHTDAELCELSRRLGGLEGETRVVTELQGTTICRLPASFTIPVFTSPL